MSVSTRSELLSALALLRRHRLLVAITTLAVAAASVAFTLLATPLYRASADILVTEPDRSAVFSPTPAYVGRDPQYLETQLKLVTTPATQEIAEEQLGARAEAVREVEAEQLSSTSIIRVSALAEDPDTAAAAAQAYASAYLTQQRTSATDALGVSREVLASKIAELRTARAALEARIAQLEAAGSASALVEGLRTERDGIIEQLSTFRVRADQLEIDAAAEVGTARIVAPAAAPDSPASPRPLLNLLLGLLGGFLLGFGLAALASRVSERVPGDLDELRSELAGLGREDVVLGGIPSHDSEPGVASLVDPQGAAAEAFRMIWAGLQFVSMQRPMKQLLITSPMPGDGKTTVSTNLAVAFARAGVSTVLVDCDLRKPQVGTRMGIEAAPGFTDVVRDAVPLVDALVPVPGHPDLPLHLLPAGTLPPNPTEVLSSEAARLVLEELAERFEVVILDTPPLLPVADSTVLAARADRVLLVTSSTSKSSHLRQALDRLIQTGAHLTGVVLNKERRSTDSYRAYRSYAATASAPRTLRFEPRAQAASTPQPVTPPSAPAPTPAPPAEHPAAPVDTAHPQAAVAADQQATPDSAAPQAAGSADRRGGTDRRVRQEVLQEPDRRSGEDRRDQPPWEGIESLRAAPGRRLADRISVPPPPAYPEAPDAAAGYPDSLISPRPAPRDSHPEGTAAPGANL